MTQEHIQIEMWMRKRVSHGVVKSGKIRELYFLHQYFNPKNKKVLLEKKYSLNNTLLFERDKRRFRKGVYHEVHYYPNGVLKSKQKLIPETNNYFLKLYSPEGTLSQTQVRDLDTHEVIGYCHYEYYLQGGIKTKEYKKGNEHLDLFFNEKGKMILRSRYSS